MKSALNALIVVIMIGFASGCDVQNGPRPAEGTTIISNGLMEVFGISFDLGDAEIQTYTDTEFVAFSSNQGEATRPSELRIQKLELSEGVDGATWVENRCRVLGGSLNSIGSGVECYQETEHSCIVESSSRARFSRVGVEDEADLGEGVGSECDVAFPMVVRHLWFFNNATQEAGVFREVVPVGVSSWSSTRNYL